MRPGSVIVDLAASTGGNCELTQPDDVVVIDGVSIIGYTNLAARKPYDASQMYARNVTAFVGLIGKDGELDFSDEILDQSCVTHAGEVRVPRCPRADRLMNPHQKSGRLVEGLRTVLFGVGVCAGLLYMFFFATAESVQVVVLLATIAMLLWFGTADPARMVDGNRRPHWRLFLLAGLGLALLISAMLALSSGTMLLTMAIGLIAIVTGLFRAVRHGIDAEA